MSFIWRRIPAIPVVKLACSLLVSSLLLLFSCFLTPMAAFAAGDANESSCGNEALVGFSPELPDCRAFERVTSTYVGGTVVHGLIRDAPQMSRSGTELLTEAFGGYAGAERVQQAYTDEGDVYLYTRTPTGWEAEAQGPPESQYPWAIFEGASINTMRSSVWQVSTTPEDVEPFPEKPDDFEYILRTGKGEFSTVGPAAAPGHEENGVQPGNVQGVSEGGAHIIFDVVAQSKFLWPGDGTSESVTGGREATLSLYEYHGASGGEPSLVGVSNAGPGPWRVGASHVNEGAQLLSQCGTDYDGMSVNGSVVFFTAMHQSGCTAMQPAADELFARVNGSETVAISEPSAESCAVCTVSGVPGEARFQGASENGEIVYFTSTQALLPGASGTSLYEFDFAAPVGRRVTLVAPDVTATAGSSASGERIYLQSSAVLTAGGNANGEVPQAGGENIYLFDASAATLAFVATAASSAYLDPSREGGFLAFESVAHLTGTDDTSAVPQLFEYDGATRQVSRVSRGARVVGGAYCSGTHQVTERFNCDGNTADTELSPEVILRFAPYPVGETQTHGSEVVNRPVVTGSPARNGVAENGTVVFSSQLPLTPEAVEGHVVVDELEIPVGTAENFYEYRDGEVYLLNSANEMLPPFKRSRSNLGTWLLGVDASGRDIYFGTASDLLGEGSSGQVNLYDAREDGGFSAPPAPAGCEGEACQGTPPPTPGVFGAPASATVVADSGGSTSAVPALPKSTDVSTKKKCRKGTKRERNRCIELRPKHKKQTHRGAK
jgi:hypothetical protein